MKDKDWIWLIALVLLFGLLAGAMFMSECKGSSSEPESLTEAQSLEACKDAIRDQLKAPRSAKWPDEPVISEAGTGHEIALALDAQNPMGVYLRSGWLCVTEKADAGASVVRVSKETGSD